MNTEELAKNKNSMNILYLTLKKQWFDLILSGEKVEEYREVKPYWSHRLHKKVWDVINFHNGYSKNSPWFNIECIGFCCGTGNQKWGAPPDQDVYILKLGKIIEYSQSITQLTVKD